MARITAFQSPRMRSRSHGGRGRDAGTCACFRQFLRLAPAARSRRRSSQGCDVLFDIDWQGAQQIQKSALAPHVLSIFLLPPSIAELRRRLEQRAAGRAETIGKRMQKSWDEISHWDGYDYVLVNDDLDATEEKLKTIVTAERLRRAASSPGCWSMSAICTANSRRAHDLRIRRHRTGISRGRSLGRARCQPDRQGDRGRGLGLVRLRRCAATTNGSPSGRAATCRRTA
jgi:hypothetical protein